MKEGGKSWKAADSSSAVARPGSEELRWEVYLCPWRQALPTIRVPLRRGEPDVPLALQPLVDRCYRTGRHWLSSNSAKTLQPPLAGPEEVAWLEERLHAAEVQAK